jgi:Amt family ammonium transporter
MDSSSDPNQKVQCILDFVDGLSSRLDKAEAFYSPESDRNLLLYATDYDTGDTAWLLTATSLVLFMTLPGLALYYAGMLRVKNVLPTVMQVFSIACIITALWMFFGYSLSYGPANKNTKGNLIFGDGSRLWLWGMSLHSYHQIAPTIPEPVFCAYELTFAIIAPCLICGSFADRMKYLPMLLFMSMWHLIIYCPIAHSVWHPDGFLYKANVIDHAGGLVIHLSSGVSGLVAAQVVGKREGGGQHEFDPHNILFSFIGTCMLWVGWFGFNAGSNFRADSNATMSLLSTHLAASISTISWVAVEWAVRGKPSVFGAISGGIAGLVCITPGSGQVNVTGAFLTGLTGGMACYLGCQLKNYFGFDDVLDAFGVHAVGGVVGMISAGFYATSTVGAENGVYYGSTHVGGHTLAKQLYGCCVVAGWSAFGTYVIAKLIDLTIGLRVEDEHEIGALEKSNHDVDDTLNRAGSFVETDVDDCTKEKNSIENQDLATEAPQDTMENSTIVINKDVSSQYSL